MMKLTRILLICVLSASTVAAAPPERASRPMKLIRPQSYKNWRISYPLENESMKVVIVEATGRVAHLGLKGGPNLLRQDEELLGKVPDGKDRVLNYGGEWLWPVARSRWEAIDGKPWPPEALAEREWKGSAWITADGRHCCTMTLSYGDPVNVHVSRLFKLDRR